MASFTTQITDAKIIAELPDVSILSSIYDDKLTKDEMISSMNSVSFRKKFQTLLEFKLSDASKATMLSTLEDGYSKFETAAGKTVTVKNGNTFVDDRLVAFTVDGFADGLFEDASFAALFFTSDVIDVIFGSDDKSFISALTSVSNFWDKLFADSDLAKHFETTYPKLITSLVKENEIAYVKIVTNKAGLDVQKYKDIKYLAEDTGAMDAIYVTTEARDIEKNSKFGSTARLMYIFNKTDIAGIASDEANVDALKKDTALRNAILNIDTVLVLPIGSKMREYILGSDRNFGIVISGRLNIETNISLTNLFFDETYADYLIKFVQDKDLVNLIFESSLYTNVKEQFYNAFMKLNTLSQKFSFKINEDTKTFSAHYATSEFKARKLTLSLDSFTETKAGSVSDVKTKERVFYAPYTFIDSSMLAVRVDHEVEFDNPDNYNLYSELLDDSFNTIVGGNGHIIGMTTKGKIVSSKFVVDLNLSTEHIEDISVTENNAFIRTTETFHSIGNLGADKADIIKNLISNKDDLFKALYFNGQVLALKNDNTIQIVGKDGISAFAAASKIAVTNMFAIAGKLIVLAKDGTLSEIKKDNTIVSINTKVADIIYSQDAIVCTVDGKERAIFSSNGTWMTYDFNVNTLN